MIAAGLAAYANSLAGAFVLDDHAHILDNPSIRALGLPARDGGRPLVALTLALNYAAGGVDPRGYHAVNLAVHLLAALALFGLVTRTLRRGAHRGDGPTAERLGLAAAVLWVAHPLTTQGVTYVIQRGESMMALFYLLTLYCAARSADPEHPVRWQLLGVAACLLGALSKQVIVTAPVVVLLYDRVFLAPSLGEALRRRPLLHAGVGACSLLVVLATLAAFDPRQSSGVGSVHAGVTWLEYARTQPEVVVRYLRLALWPSGLCFDYAWPVQDSAARVAASAAVVAALAGITLWALRRHPGAGFLGACFFVILAPTSSVVPVRDLAVEHRMYLPLAALVVLAVLGLRAAVARLPRPLVGALLAATASALAAGTHARNRDYRSEEALWRLTAGQRPLNARAHANLAHALLARGADGEARAHLETALRLRAHNPRAEVMLGDVEYRAARYDEAARHYARAVAMNPGLAMAHNRLGTVFDVTGDLERAMGHYRDALERDPEYAEARYNVGRLHERAGRLDEAITEFRGAARVDPLHANAHYRLGRALRRRGDLAGAAAALGRALAVDPRHTDARRELDSLNAHR